MEYITLSYPSESDSVALETCTDPSKIKICQACGKQFVYKLRQQKFCTRDHYKICEICGKEYNVNLAVGIDHLNRTCSRGCANQLLRQSVEAYNQANPKVKKEPLPATKILTCEFCGAPFEVASYIERRYCSDDCRRQARRLKFQSTTRVCMLCGKGFHPVNTRNYICSDIHYRPCPVCGKPVEVKQACDGLRVCSPECKEEQKRRTCQQRYGVDIASQAEHNRKKLHDSMVALEPKKQKALFAKYGVTNVAQIPEVKEKISKTVTSKECQAQTQATNIERYGVPYAMQSRDLLLKQTESTRNSIAEDGRPLDSSYEKKVYEFCIRNNLDFKMQLPIEYQYEGKSHVTYIDFKIGDILFEVKGSHLLKGLFDYGPSFVPIDVKLDLYRKHHVVVITDKNASDLFGRPNSTESNGLKYLKKCPNPLIGVDINLFDHPSFPYRDDRPPVFYQTRVHGQQSSVEAFQDESIRWKMILNRIMYSGGFIDSNQVLTAMNVSRICKQPSWFSKSFAKEIIQRYITSDTIVDPFAGWGTRHDAAIELHKTYVGCDLNEQLVTWHQLHGRNIKFGDAKQFKFNSECSVFICPPYQDIETYFEGQDIGLTQCQWLQVVMKNVPKAKEYIMVCKVVDPGFEQYIVDTKVNKSHFGVNNEYILVIHNR